MEYLYLLPSEPGVAQSATAGKGALPLQAHYAKLEEWINENLTWVIKISLPRAGPRWS